jgi:hypothetical protein
MSGFISHFDPTLGTPGIPGQGVSPGGETDQILAKSGPADYATYWRDERTRNVIPEAPVDGELYGRRDADWRPVVYPDGLPDGGDPGDQLTRADDGAAVWRPPVVLPAIEFQLGPLDFIADGTEAPNSIKSFSFPTTGLPAGYFCTPVAIWAMRRTADGTPTPSGSWSCELSWPDTGGGPGTFNPIGSTQNYAQVFNANRILLYSLAGAAQPCMDPAIGSFSWRFRFTGGALLTGPFSIQTGFLGRLYPNV